MRRRRIPRRSLAAGWQRCRCRHPEGPRGSPALTPRCWSAWRRPPAALMSPSVGSTLGPRIPGAGSPALPNAEGHGQRQDERKGPRDGEHQSGQPDRPACPAQGPIISRHRAGGPVPSSGSPPGPDISAKAGPNSAPKIHVPGPSTVALEQQGGSRRFPQRSAMLGVGTGSRCSTAMGENHRGRHQAPARPPGAPHGSAQCHDPHSPGRGSAAVPEGPGAPHAVQEYLTPLALERRTRTPPADPLWCPVGREAEVSGTIAERVSDRIRPPPTAPRLQKVLPAQLFHQGTPRGPAGPPPGHSPPPGQTPPTRCLPQCARKPTVLDWRSPLISMMSPHGTFRLYMASLLVKPRAYRVRQSAHWWQRRSWRGLHRIPVAGPQAAPEQPLTAAIRGTRQMDWVSERSRLKARGKCQGCQTSPNRPMLPP